MQARHTHGGLHPRPAWVGRTVWELARPVRRMYTAPGWQKKAAGLSKAAIARRLAISRTSVRRLLGSVWDTCLCPIRHKHVSQTDPYIRANRAEKTGTPAAGAGRGNCRSRGAAARWAPQRTPDRG